MGIQEELEFIKERAEYAMKRLEKGYSDEAYSPVDEIRGIATDALKTLEAPKKTVLEELKSAEGALARVLPSTELDNLFTNSQPLSFYLVQAQAGIKDAIDQLEKSKEAMQKWREEKRAQRE